MDGELERISRPAPSSRERTSANIKARAARSANLADKEHFFDISSPRLKQAFMYMAGISDEEAFDAMAERMTLRGDGGQVRCPTSLVAGEFGPLSSIEAVFSLFEELGGSKKMWVLQNEFHRV